MLLLRDVYDYSTRECAAALELSEPNVKTTLHRARRALAEYDRDRNPPTERLRASTASALERLLSCFATRDAGGDGRAPRQRRRRRSRTAAAASTPRKNQCAAETRWRSSSRASCARATWRRCASSPRDWNGLPGVMIERDGMPDRYAPRFTFSLELDRDGLIRRTYAVLNPAKLER